MLGKNTQTYFFCQREPTASSLLLRQTHTYKQESYFLCWLAIFRPSHLLQRSMTFLKTHTEKLIHLYLFFYTRYSQTHHHHQVDDTCTELRASFPLPLLLLILSADWLTTMPRQVVLKEKNRREKLLSSLLECLWSSIHRKN